MEDDGDQVLESKHAENALSAHAEASKMLEAALQQMDGIIAGELFVLYFFLVCLHKHCDLYGFSRHTARAAKTVWIRLSHSPKIYPRSSRSTSGLCRATGSRQEASLQVGL